MHTKYVREPKFCSGSRAVFIGPEAYNPPGTSIRIEPGTQVNILYQYSNSTKDYVVLKPDGITMILPEDSLELVE